MAKKKTYYDYLRQEMSDLIDELQLSDFHKHSLKSRWLDQLIWADKKAAQCRRWHYRLRLTTIIGGVILPALVGINFQLDKINPYFRDWFPYIPFALSQVIAVSAAVDEFCRFGDRWRDYRRMAEDLKAEGWQYLQLSGPYQYNIVSVESPAQKAAAPVAEEHKAVSLLSPPKGKVHKIRTNHLKSFSLFASRVESIIKNDVQNYISDLLKQQTKEDQEMEKYLESAQSVSKDKTLFSPSYTDDRSVDSLDPGSPDTTAPLGYPRTPGYAPSGVPNQSTAVNANPLDNVDNSIMPAYGSVPTPAESPLAFTTPAQPLAAVSTPVASNVGIAGTLKTCHDTEFKLSTLPSQVLPDLQKVFLHSDSTFGLLAYTKAENNYLRVTLNQGLGPENRNTWYVYAPHVELIGVNGQPNLDSNTAIANTNGSIQPLGMDLNGAIAAAARSLHGMSTASGPDGGNNACAWSINRVLQRAGIPPSATTPTTFHPFWMR